MTHAVIIARAVHSDNNRLEIGELTENSVKIARMHKNRLNKYRLGGLPLVAPLHGAKTAKLLQAARAAVKEQRDERPSHIQLQSALHRTMQNA